VSLRDGNVFFTNRNGQSLQVTTEGLDEDASLSADSKQVVFVRRTPDYAIDTGRGDTNSNELWIASLAPVGKAHRVLRGQSGTFKTDNTLTVAGFYLPRFSAGSLRIYFMAQTWATSDAIHVLNLATGKTTFLDSGHSVEPVYSGQFQNYVILRTDVMPRGGGHVTDYWLFDRTGKRTDWAGRETPEVQGSKHSTEIIW
jgi:hypothetical protein